MLKISWTRWIEGGEKRKSEIAEAKEEKGFLLAMKVGANGEGDIERG